MPVVFTPYLKDRLGLEESDQQSDARAESADADETEPPETDPGSTLLTRRQVLVGAVAAVVLAIAAVRRRGSAASETDSEQPRA
ncbi:MAG: hypothetical protein ACI8TL_000993 [Natronomonas sp.]|jgi:hypothetical protein